MYISYPKVDPSLITKSSNGGIELNGSQGLPPEWVDDYDTIKANLEKINVLRNSLLY